MFKHMPIDAVLPQENNELQATETTKLMSENTHLMKNMIFSWNKLSDQKPKKRSNNDQSLSIVNDVF